MMHPPEKMLPLLQYASPSKVGKVTPEEWHAIEEAHGILPQEYKDIVSVLGFGSFGDFTLFHPASTYDMTNLRLAREIHWEILGLSFPAAIDLLKSPQSLLGIGPTRHIMAWNDGWWHIDFEMEEALEVGSSLSGFLLSEYLAAISSPYDNRIGNAIWVTGDGTPLDFFQPAERY